MLLITPCTADRLGGVCAQGRWAIRAALPSTGYYSGFYYEDTSGQGYMVAMMGGWPTSSTAGHRVTIGDANKGRWSSSEASGYYPGVPYYFASNSFLGNPNDAADSVWVKEGIRHKGKGGGSLQCRCRMAAQCHDSVLPSYL